MAFSDKLVDFYNKIIFKILNSSFCSALVAFIPFFIFKNNSEGDIKILIAMIAVLSLFSVLFFNKKVTKIECFKFAIYIFIFSLLINFVLIFFVVLNIIFFSIMMILLKTHQSPLLFDIFRVFARLITMAFSTTFAAVLTYYSTNLVFFKIFNLPGMKDFGKKVSNSVKKPIFAVVLFIFVLFASVYSYSVKCITAIPVTITSFTEIFDYYRFSFYSLGNYKIYSLQDNKICFMNLGQDKFYIYDVKNHMLSDEYTLFDKTKDNDKSCKTDILPLKNGNIFIKQRISTRDKNKFLKTVLKVYSPHKKAVISSIEVPDEDKFNGTQVELRDNRIMFFASSINGSKRTFVLNPNDNTFEETANLNISRRSTIPILLNDGRVFVFGGAEGIYHENFAEIYNPYTNSFKKVSLNFNVDSYTGKTKLSLLSDGRVLIACERSFLNKKDGSATSSHRYRNASGSFVTEYQVPYLTIFNPIDNSFEEIDINKKNKGLIRTNYDVAELENGNIMIAGGKYISTITNHNVKKAKDILIYNTKTHTLKNTNQNLNYEHQYLNTITVLNDGSALIAGFSSDKPTRENQIERIIFK